MLHLLAMIFFSGAAVAAVRLIWTLIGEEWDAVERALGLVEPIPCPDRGRCPARRPQPEAGLRRGNPVRPMNPLRAAA